MEGHSRLQTLPALQEELLFGGGAPEHDDQLAQGLRHHHKGGAVVVHQVAALVDVRVYTPKMGAGHRSTIWTIFLKDQFLKYLIVREIDRK